MKIKKVHLSEHPPFGTMFGTMSIDFTGPGGKPLDTVVVAGINGTGKTTLLLTLLRIMTDDSTVHMKSKYTPPYIELDISHLPGYDSFTGGVEVYQSSYDRPYAVWMEKLDYIDERIRPKMIYMPTEINFEGLKTKNLSFSTPYHFENIVNQDVIDNVPSFIASTINSEVYKHPDLPAKGAIDKVCNEINELFGILDIDAKMVGLNPEGEKLPIFENSAGKVFDINHLSSGEKQLFVRAMALRMLNANNSIILIDEPEISMHPGWQQRIVGVYEKIGKNNQIIFATHSPHVVASVPKESVKLLKREKGQIKVVGYDEINGSYGLPVDIVLKELMELETVRDPGVDKEIRTLWDMLHKKQQNSKEFDEKYRWLEDLLGSEDEDLLLMRIEIAKLNAQKEKMNAGNKKG